MQQLPDDVWIEIVEWHIPRPVLFVQHRRTDLLELSLTCKRLRRIVLPVIYRTLVFSPHSGVEKQSDALTGLVRSYTRIKGLHTSPHPLHHVRELTFSSWSNSSLQDTAWYDDLREAEYLQSAVYDSAINFLPHMTGLRTFEILDCNMTPHLHQFISLIPRLHTLQFMSWLVLTGWRGILQLTSIPSHLRHLRYHVFHCPVADLYITQTLNHCLVDLKTLEIKSGYLTYVLDSAANRRLSLRRLDIYHQSGDADFEAEMWSLLVYCEELRILRVPSTEKIFEESSGLVPNALVPNLEVVVGVSPMVQALIPRRPLKCMKITGAVRQDVYLNPTLWACLATSLEKLSLRIMAESFLEVVAFLQILRPVKRLTHLTIIACNIGVSESSMFLAVRRFIENHQTKSHIQSGALRSHVSCFASFE